MLLRRSPVRGSGLYLAHKLLTFRSMLRLYCAGIGLTSFTLARFATRGFLGWGCSPLDIIHYSTFDGVCQEEILVFFFSTARSHLHLGHYLPLAQPTGSHSLLTLCSIAQVGMDYNRQTIQVSGKINKKICVKKLLTKLLAGCIMVNSGRDARNRPAIIPCPGAFVNR